MAEKTMAADTQFRLYGMERVEGEFVEIGGNIFDSEDVSDVIYTAYLKLMTDKWERNGVATIDDVGSIYIKGFFLPCTARTVLAGQVDLLNDELPNYAGLSTWSSQREPCFTSVRRLVKAPREHPLPPGVTPYKATLWVSENDKLEAFTVVVGVKRDGTFCFTPNTLPGTRGMPVFVHSIAATINAWNDAKYVWQVAASETVLSNSWRTPLILGTDAEQIKSLFYARSLPYTSIGRKRPILHWVKAHQRRLKEGIEIDISSYLRGIEEFEMDSIKFTIMNPTKGNPAITTRDL